MARPAERVESYFAPDRLFARATWRRSVCTAAKNPTTISAIVAPRLAGVIQVRQVPIRAGASYMGRFSILPILPQMAIRCPGVNSRFAAKPPHFADTSPGVNGPKLRRSGYFCLAAPHNSFYLIKTAIVAE